ncbi:M50 family metallopeptidase [Propioniciclava tarda]|uniref:PDZ domain-containing protein n=1 Tax=Propioniciclava tarda TaxID=433330 RepID=A0A4V2JTE2_PROTD|nr:site-2 protease family protein [Propioniciclava tarda]TBT95651.1 PDZ domain-containing protein [Propioniciclava tarda]SMO46790.1 Membrane-associated protease RseP, regulator of RpoE activity [Propioniciclava tarda]
MTILLNVVFGLLFFAALMACVALHEVGHMLPAKLFGVKVPKYFVGFGKTLWSTKRGETEYGVKVFPLGGFVQLLGMYPPRRPDARDTRLQRFADDAREAEWEDIEPADQAAHRLFYQQKTWQKLVMMAGGITMNLLLAFVLTWGVLGFHGAVRQQTTVSGVAACSKPSNPDGTCAATDPASPAVQAGLTAGDKIVEFNGVAITSFDQLTALIRANADREASVVVERGGVRTPLKTVHTVVDARRDNLDPSKFVQVGTLGFGVTAVLQKGGPVEAIGDLKTMTEQSVVALVQLPVKAFNVVADLVTGKPRDVYGPISVVGASTVAGEVATADLPVGYKVAMFVSLLASVNLFLALFNLVPLPPLDGGHIVGALYEVARRGVARLRGLPDPGPADTAKMLPVAYLVGGLVLLMGVGLIVADIVSPVKIF